MQGLKRPRDPLRVTCVTAEAKFGRRSARPRGTDPRWDVSRSLEHCKTGGPVSQPSDRCEFGHDGGRQPALPAPLQGPGLGVLDPPAEGAAGKGRRRGRRKGFRRALGVSRSGKKSGCPKLLTLNNYISLGIWFVPFHVEGHPRAFTQGAQNSLIT